MSAKSHGTRRRYNEGCRCDECKAAQCAYQRRYRERKANGLTRPTIAEFPHSAPGGEIPHVEVPELGPVESAVESELAGLPAAQSRPAMSAIALAMARILDSAKVASAQPAAAKVLVNVLDALHKGSAQQRRGKLAVVKSMTTNSPSA